MIREEVEKLRGVLFTPEELESVIIPAVKATTEKKNKPRHDCYVTNKLLDQFYYKYSAWNQEAQKCAKLYGLLRDMAKNDPDRLLGLWDKVLEKRMLFCPEDIDEELLLAFDVGSIFMVYDCNYQVSSFSGRDANVVHFRKL